MKKKKKKETVKIFKLKLVEIGIFEEKERKKKKLAGSFEFETLRQREVYLLFSRYTCLLALFAKKSIGRQ